ncbi:hypothetical protein KL930_000631 [Ogataea haglerorum]|uniref:DUF218 domain-containing protein n=1 Tax=Ogataea haglerorum TaxID=1937702 RepID=A0AAN6I3S5_9ASCO|nr:uncharacterized protein KL911_003314 [Ogataea haglerorum]KAG7699944.1 hypothetical protein KL915_000633 [Ogataea haglerorum]KAG7701602.1 hypothetical protein KL951_000058 [Ogataea haglerorum]KAG7711416.1 hypothetical protein KL914_000058 [Ogataea haglerorum]KAG7722238.1 hypothetical protein KL913_000058 [Ogataea haglerorum]KAG7723659.1 hypothetical protein KL949_000709 [Ogataea haglerorum]
MTTLILLPCHSVFIAAESTSGSQIQLKPQEDGPGFNQNDWILAPFQYEANDHLSFVEHIHKAFDLLNANPDARLVISGGFTKEGLNISESDSYLQVARLRGLITEQNKDRIYLDEYARDSYENLLLAIALFRKKTGRFPRRTQIVGFQFKRYRFLELHAKVLKLKHVEYFGIGPSYPSAAALHIPEHEWETKCKRYFDDLQFSEKRFATDLFEQDWFGCIGSKLYDKKVSRDPLKRGLGRDFYSQDLEPILNAFLGFDQLTFPEAKAAYDNLGPFPW